LAPAVTAEKIRTGLLTACGRAQGFEWVKFGRGRARDPGGCAIQRRHRRVRRRGPGDGRARLAGVRGRGGRCAEVVIRPGRAGLIAAEVMCHREFGVAGRDSGDGPRCRVPVRGAAGARRG